MGKNGSADSGSSRPPGPNLFADFGLTAATRHRAPDAPEWAELAHEPGNTRQSATNIARGAATILAEACPGSADRGSGYDSRQTELRPGQSALQSTPADGCHHGRRLSGKSAHITSRGREGVPDRAEQSFQVVFVDLRGVRPVERLHLRPDPVGRKGGILGRQNLAKVGELVVIDRRGNKCSHWAGCFV